MNRHIVGFLVSTLLGSPSLVATAPAPRLDGIEPQLASREYDLTHHGDAWQAPNRAHGFRTTFEAGGVTLRPRVDEGDPWEVALSLIATGRPGALEAAAPATLRVSGQRAELVRGPVVEWYVNDDRGLEQGFTFASEPTPERGDVAVDLAVTGSLRAVVAVDGRSARFDSADGIAVLEYVDLRVTDAHGTTLPSRMEPLGSEGDEGIRLRFDDSGAVYPVVVDPRIKSPEWTAVNGQVASWFGYSSATAGDVNGDGYSDVIVGAPAYDNGEGDEGRTFVYLGSPAGLQSSPAWTAESDQAGATFGWSVSAAGDVNGDGYDEVLVGAPAYGNGEWQEGRAYLYYGSAAGLSPTAGWVVESNQLGANLGNAVSTAGDVNGDGYADVIVGAPYYDNGQSDEGRVLVYLGSASGLSMTPAWSAEPNQSSTEFGGAVATAGDVNGDGYADVIVGSRYYDNVEFNEGRAFVYLGSASGLAASPVWTAEPNQAGAAYGTSVATAGDVNGDGYADIAVGAPDWDGPENGEGRAYVYLGSAAGPGASAAWTVEPNSAGARLGAWVGTAGDGNGDGYADVIVGAEGYNSLNGKILVYFGSPSGLATVEGLQREGGFGYHLGASVGTAGDVDGDGFSDLIYGAYVPGGQGRVTVTRFAGADMPATTAAWTGEGNQASAGYGVSVASAGDVDGDGYADVVVGAYLWDNGQTDEGRALLYLGSATGLAASPAWSFEGDETVAELGISVASAGDVNGDGYSDVVVGADGGGGKVRVFHGSPAGLPASPDWIAAGPSEAAAFGYSVASAGDVNGDGYSDVIVGARYYSGDQALEGSAYVYLGSASGLATVPAWQAEGNQVNAYFGNSVAGAGDVNGDGYSDVIVGAPGYDNGQTDEGRAYVYLGSASGLAAAPAWTTEGDRADAWYALSVASGGDVNGDGYSDVLVASPFAAVNQPSCLLYFGSAVGLGSTPSWPSAIGFHTVAAAGDVDGDGYGDILAWPNATLYRGSASGFLQSPDWTVAVGTAVLGIGSPIASAGDVNGDGYADVVVGSNQYTHDAVQEGGAFLYLGAGPSPVARSRARAPHQLRSDGVTPISLLGKSDTGSGFRLRAPGFSAAGRARLRLRWEVKPLGAAFDGAGVGTSALVETGAPGSGGSLASFDEQASGLGPATAYHWRARTVSPDPYFPRAPWMSAGGAAAIETRLRTSGCADLDGDGYGAPVDPACASLVPDCNDANAAVWARPGPTANLRFGSKTDLSYDAPASPGGLPSALVYDTLRSTDAASFTLATCIQSDGATTATTDPATPAVAQAFYYLSRAQNACPQGAGSLGTTSADVERTGRNCP